MSRYKKVVVRGLDERNPKVVVDVPAILDTETGLVAPFTYTESRDFWFRGGREALIPNLTFAKVHEERPEGADLDTFWNMREEVNA